MIKKEKNLISCFPNGNMLYGVVLIMGLAATYATFYASYTCDFVVVKTKAEKNGTEIELSLGLWSLEDFSISEGNKEQNKLRRRRMTRDSAEKKYMQESRRLNISSAKGTHNDSTKESSSFDKITLTTRKLQINLSDAIKSNNLVDGGSGKCVAYSSDNHLLVSMSDIDTPWKFAKGISVITTLILIPSILVIIVLAFLDLEFITSMQQQQKYMKYMAALTMVLAVFSLFYLVALSSALCKNRDLFDTCQIKGGSSAAVLSSIMWVVVSVNIWIIKPTNEQIEKLEKAKSKNESGIDNSGITKDSSPNHKPNDCNNTAATSTNDNDLSMSNQSNVEIPEAGQTEAREESRNSRKTNQKKLQAVREDDGVHFPSSVNDEKELSSGYEAKEQLEKVNGIAKNTSKSKNRGCEETSEHNMAIEKLCKEKRITKDMMEHLKTNGIPEDLKSIGVLDPGVAASIQSLKYNKESKELLSHEQDNSDSKNGKEAESANHTGGNNDFRKDEHEKGASNTSNSNYPNNDKRNNIRDSHHSKIDKKSSKRNSQHSKNETRSNDHDSNHLKNETKISTRDSQHSRKDDGSKGQFSNSSRRKSLGSSGNRRRTSNDDNGSIRSRRSNEDRNDIQRRKSNDDCISDRRRKSINHDSRSNRRRKSISHGNTSDGKRKIEPEGKHETDNKNRRKKSASDENNGKYETDSDMNDSIEVGVNGEICGNENVKISEHQVDKTTSHRKPGQMHNISSSTGDPFQKNKHKVDGQEKKFQKILKDYKKREDQTQNKLFDMMNAYEEHKQQLVQVRGKYKEIKQNHDEIDSSDTAVGKMKKSGHGRSNASVHSRSNSSVQSRSSSSVQSRSNASVHSRGNASAHSRGNDDNRKMNSISSKEQMNRRKSSLSKNNTKVSNSGGDKKKSKDLSRHSVRSSDSADSLEKVVAQQYFKPDAEVTERRRSSNGGSRRNESQKRRSTMDNSTDYKNKEGNRSRNRHDRRRSHKA